MITYMQRRAIKELVASLHDPKEARNYIRQYNWGGGPRFTPKIFNLNCGRDVDLTSMNDNDAILVALEIVHDIEIPRAEKELQLWKFSLS